MKQHSVTSCDPHFGRMKGNKISHRKVFEVFTWGVDAPRVRTAKVFWEA